MSTRGRIGMVRNDGTVASIYHHSDSYPKYLGRMLLTHYKDAEKVSKLIALGDCSIVCEEVDIPEGASHSFRYRLPNVTVAYGRDRGEKGTDAIVDNNVEDYRLADNGQWAYLFKDGKWFVIDKYSRYGEDGEYLGESERILEPLTEEYINTHD